MFRDLKPNNILLDKNMHVKLSDFGISYWIDADTQTKTCNQGTLKFMAPELLKEKNDYDQKFDVYSFGVVIFFILTGGKYPDINIIDVGNGKKAEIPKEINEISRELINKCWSYQPEERFSFEKIIEYIKNNNFKLIDGIEKDLNQIKEFLNLL